MRFQVLGSLRVQRRGEPIALSTARKPRQVLALLLSRSDRFVSTDWLIEALWSFDSPASARRNIQQYVHEIRQTIGSDVLTSHAGGYTLHVGNSLDANEFSRQAAMATAANVAGAPEVAARQLRSALDLWHGDAYEEFTGCEPIAEEAQRLEQLRLAAYVRLAQAELACGRHMELASELAVLVARFPFQEQLQAQYMLALYRAGQRGAALEVYRTSRRLLADEMGVEPGPELRELHQKILRGEVTQGDPDATRITDRRGGHGAAINQEAGPSPLPRAPARLVGRAEHLLALDAIAARTKSTPGAGLIAPVAVISALTGTAGVGKTALAVRWATDAGGWFPDGTLYVNLRGFDGTAPLTAQEALTTLLLQIGLPASQVPQDATAATARYRSLLHGLRTLVVLDNAASAAQVRPLLPTGAGCMAVVTSRDRLVGLVAIDDAVPVHLDVLSPDHSHELLAALVGPERLSEQPAAAQELAEVCGHLPLALRIAGAILVADPSLTADALVRRLSGARRIAGLSIDGDADACVATVLHHSYRLLSTSAKELFRQLSLVPGQDFTVAAASAIAGREASQVQADLSALEQAHLLHSDFTGRYRFHDLIRDYARGMAQPGEAVAPLDRILRWYLEHAYLASIAFRPEPETPEWVPNSGMAAFVDMDRAADWMAGEYANLLDAVRVARHALPERCWQLANTLFVWMDRQSLVTARLEIAAAAAEAAAECGDLAAEASMKSALAIAYCRLARQAEALPHFERTVEVRRLLGSSNRQLVVALMNLGGVLGELQQTSPAIGYLEEALAIIDRDPTCQDKLAPILDNLGIANSRSSAPDNAIPHYRRALDVARTLEDDAAIAASANNLGVLLGRLGRHGEAREMLEVAVQHAIAIHDQRLAAAALLGSSMVAIEQGDAREARELLTRSLQTGAENHLVGVAELQEKIAAVERSGR